MSPVGGCAALNNSVEAARIFNSGCIPLRPHRRRRSAPTRTRCKLAPKGLAHPAHRTAGFFRYVVDATPGCVFRPVDTAAGGVGAALHAVDDLAVTRRRLERVGTLCLGWVVRALRMRG